jgi:phospholipid transport system substrate-binding protein
VLGTHWKTATPEQQKRFINAFRDLLVRTYSSALVEAAGDKLKVNYLPVKDSGARSVTLRTEVAQGNNKPIIVEYAMYVPDADWMKQWNINTPGWKVYNVTVEGVSLVTNYRTEFANDIERMGMEGLIKKVQAKQIEQ